MVDTKKVGQVQFPIEQYAAHLLHLTQKLSHNTRKFVTGRDLHAATIAIAESLRDSKDATGKELVFSVEDIRKIDRLLLGAFARNQLHEIPEGRRYSFSQAVTKLCRAATAAIEQGDTATAIATDAPAISILPSPLSWEDARAVHICPDSFADATGKLDKVEALGANHVWLGPVEVAEEDGLTQLDARVGTMASLRHFVDAAHRRGIRVMLDLNCQCATAPGDALYQALAKATATFVKQSGIDAIRLDSNGHIPPEQRATLGHHVSIAVRKLGLKNFNLLPEQSAHAVDTKFVKSRTNPDAPFSAAFAVAQAEAFARVLAGGADTGAFGGTWALEHALTEQDQLIAPNLAHTTIEGVTGLGESSAKLNAALTLQAAWPGVPVISLATDPKVLAAAKNILYAPRQQLPELRRGSTYPLWAENGSLFAFARQYEGNATIAVVNTGGDVRESQRIYVSDKVAVAVGDKLRDFHTGLVLAVKADKTGKLYVDVPALAPYQSLLLSNVERSSRLVSGPTSIKDVNLIPAGKITPSPKDWRDYRFYAVMVDRFANGDTENDKLGWAGFDPSDPWKSHGGDLAGVLAHLDYIQNLGCNALWLSPLAQNFGTYHGYSAINALAVDPSRGTADELRQLVDECHRRGMRVVLDVVPNHTADVREYPQGQQGFSEKNVPGTRFRSDRPVVVPRELRFHDQGGCEDWQDKNQALNGDLFGQLSDLDTEDPQTVRTLADTYKWWIANFDVDGFRIDAVKHAPKKFWDRFNDEVLRFAQKIGKDNFLLMPEYLEGRPEDQRPATTVKLRDGDTANLAPLNHPLFFALKAVANGAPSSALCNILREMNEFYPVPTLNGKFADNHDFPRFLHDLGGNRKTYTAVLTTLYGVAGLPIIYYGSEQGFSGGADPWCREDMFRNPELKYATVPKPGGDNFDENSELYQLFRKLNALHAELDELRRGDTEIRWERNDRPDMFAIARKLPGSEVIVAGNLTDNETEAKGLHLDPEVFTPGDLLCDRLNHDRVFKVRGSKENPTIDLWLEPQSAVILTKV